MEQVYILTKVKEENILKGEDRESVLNLSSINDSYSSDCGGVEAANINSFFLSYFSLFWGKYFVAIY
jgi:hypothetical protein